LPLIGIASIAGLSVAPDGGGITGGTTGR